MSVFELDISSYFVNGNQTTESKFNDDVIVLLNNLIKKYDVIDVSFSDDSFELTKSNAFEIFRKIKRKLELVLSEEYSEYSAESEDNKVKVYALDSNDSVIDILDCTARNVEKHISAGSNDKFQDVTSNIPTLTNKAYNSFIDVCNQTREFLSDYSTIGQKRTFLLTKTDINAIGKAIFAPIKAWDYVGSECKMKKEEFDLLKSNLVQYSDDNVCVNLGDYHWSDVFEYIESRKTKNVKFTKSKNNFVAKIKTTVLDSKKQKLGIIIVVLSVFVDENKMLSNESGNILKGNLVVLDSNISFNMIAR